MPTTIRVMGVGFGVQVLPGAIPYTDGEGHTSEANGMYTYATGKIELSGELGLDQRRIVFLHENLHAMTDMLGLDAQLDAQAGTGCEEHVVNALAPTLLAWIRDNPEAIRWLQEVQPDA